jgi:hypothetical protein
MRQLGYFGIRVSREKESQIDKLKIRGIKYEIRI